MAAYRAARKAVQEAVKEAAHIAARKAATEMAKEREWGMGKAARQWLAGEVRTRTTEVVTQPALAEKATRPR